MMFDVVAQTFGDWIVPAGSAAAAIAALLTLVLKVGPERTQTVVGYQGEIIDDLREANKEVREEAAEAKAQAVQCNVDLAAARLENAELRARIITLERKLGIRPGEE